MNIRKHTSSDLGFSLIELLVVLLISSSLLTAALGSFTQLSKLAHDHELKTVAQLQAQSVIDVMTPEFRMIGNGVPFHQANFLIAQSNIGDNTVTQPILVAGTDASNIRFRLNETGETYILTSDFNPATQTSVTLTGISKIAVGNQIYITNSTVADDDGFWGTVSGITSGTSTVTFAAGTQYSPTGTFAKGSLFEVVPIINYASASNYGGITRDNGSGVLTLVPNGQFTLSYLNSAGTALSLPLVASAAATPPANAIQNVHSISISVSVRSSQLLSTGQYYVATATQSVGIRNLNYKY